MINRRNILHAGLSAMAPLSVTPLPAGAQGESLIKVRYSEVVRSMFFAPAYVAFTRGFFRDHGLDVALTTANGGDKAMAALLGGGADIALMGPEVPIYVLNSESPQKARIFCAMTAADGYLLMAREKVERFDWNTLRGKEIMGWRPGSTPLIFLETALRLHGLDPRSDVKLVNNIAVPARLGAWLAGQTQYAIFSEPDAAQLELDGRAHVVASIGQTVGMVDYTTFMATDKFIKDNASTVQAWTNAIAKAMKWTAAAPTPELAAALSPFFPGVSAPAMAAGIERYRRLRIWKTSPRIDPESIVKFQDILVQSQALDTAKRVKFENLVVGEFARKAL
jgi:NitT/TauT family transport system substrate-binding protein